jgi:hypothetical protein
MNQDNYYPIEIKIASKNGWSTPQEAKYIWATPYSREGITMHWWGDGTGASNHDNIVNYFLSQAQAGNKSTNYVVSDNKITLMVSPDNVAWCSNNGNPTTISIEHQPTLNAEGYKKSGWLVWQLEGRYGKRLSLYPHSKWVGTACPGSIDINRIRAEANKWASGGYLPAPPPPAPKPVPVEPPPPAPTVKIAYSKLPAPVNYVVNKNTSLWNFNSATWAGVTATKAFNKGDQFIVYGIADNLNLKAKYAMTAYSFGQADTTGSPKATTGVNMVDLDLVVAPPTPEVPKPIPPSVPVPPPVQVDPPIVEPDRNAIVAFLTLIRDMITSFLGKFSR